MEVDVERNVSTSQDRPMLGFREQIKESTADGSELVEVVLGVLRDQNASNRERIEAATWLAVTGALVSQHQLETMICLASVISPL